MTQDDFNSSFRRIIGEQLPPSDVHVLANEIFNRDQKWIQVLAVVSLVFWILGTAGMLALIFGLNRLVLYVRLYDFADGKARPAHANQPSDQMWLMDYGTTFLHHAMPYLAASVVALMLAAVLTVWLIFSARRTTLNQINFGLVQISQQLRQMRDAESKESGN